MIIEHKSLSEMFDKSQYYNNQVFYFVKILV